MAVQPVRHLFSTDDYHHMAEAGVLGPEDRIELIEGEIVEMSPIGARHAACVTRLTRIFGDLAGDDAIVRVQNPVVLDSSSELQPDVALLVPRTDYYAEAHPGPADVLLLVEVADSSVTWDRSRKLPLYAAAGVIETWLVDLAAATIEMYREPSDKGYKQLRRAMAGDNISPAALPEVSVAVTDILP